MDGDSWRLDEREPAADPDGTSADWRTQLQPEARQRIVNKITEILKRHLPISVPEGLNEHQKIAIRFEEKIYTAAANQSDYLRIISLKMLSMENKSHNSASINPSMSNGAAINQNPAVPGIEVAAAVFVDVVTISKTMDIAYAIKLAILKLDT